MKRYFLVTTLFLIAYSCSSGGDDPVPMPNPTPAGNTPPPITTLIAPTNNQLCIDNNLVFEWEAVADPDGDAVKYNLDISKNSDFTQITHSFSNLTSLTKTVELEKAIIYYWRVQAVDSKNASGDFSSIFQFYTEGNGEENHLPFAPTLILPQQNEIISGSTTTLSWGASDVDGDNLIYDIYLDTVNPPIAKVTTDYADKNYTALSLSANTTYYWKIVVKDGKGGNTIGQVWSFQTN